VDYVKVYIETYGCWLNRADSEVVRFLLKSSGHEVAESLEEADAVVVNTCAVRAETERKIAKRLRELEAWCLQKPSRRLVVAGCLARSRPAFTAFNAPSASILGPNALHRLCEALESRVVDVGPDRRLFLKLPDYDGSKRFIVPISVGCLGSCSYCIMPISRGRLTSYPPRQLVELFHRAVAGGAREIYLVAQDLSAYGVDIGLRLPHLLREMLKAQGDYFVRLGMMEPSTLLPIAEDMADIYREPNVYKYLHLPLQSGSNRVLEVMRRRYRVEEFVKLVDFIRNSVDDLFFATDVIVGFPTESEEDFEETLKVIERLKPDKVHVARYTMRPFTPAASLPQLSDGVKKRRSRVLSELVEEITLRRNLAYVGREVKVFLTDRAPRGGLAGRMASYRPVVVRCDRDLLWSFVDVVIEEARPHVLVGRLA